MVTTTRLLVSAIICCLFGAHIANAQVLAVIEGDILELDGLPAKDILRPTAVAIVGPQGEPRNRVVGVVTGTHYKIVIGQADLPRRDRAKIVQVIVHSDGNTDAVLTGLALKSNKIDVVLPKLRSPTYCYYRTRCRIVRRCR